MLVLRTKVLREKETSRMLNFALIVALVALVAFCILFLTQVSVTIPYLEGLAVLAGFFLAVGIYLNLDRLAQVRNLSQISELSNAAQALTRQEPDKPVHRLHDATVEQLFDELPVALIQIGSDDQVTRVNSAARNLLRMHEDEAPNFSDLVEGLGRSINTWLAMLRDQTARVKPEMVKVKRRRADVFFASVVSSFAGHKTGLACGCAQ